MAANTYALILAGGSGTRFWPLSRDTHPKQLLNLFDDKTLLGQTVARLQGLIPNENILILTNKAQEQSVREAVPEIPQENIFAEPLKRDTAPAIALGIGIIASRNPTARMVVLPADHLVPSFEAFQQNLAGGLEIAEKGGALVTIGIKPTWACPSYGYIERGPRAKIPNLETHIPAYQVLRFREKPNPDLAETFLKQGGFTWNAGIFIWSLPVAVSEFTRHCPQLADFIKEVRLSTNLDATIEKQFPNLPPISIDYGLMEKASRVLNIEATFEWDDVGSWISVANHLKHEEDTNKSNTDVTILDSYENIAFSKNKKHIALLGVNHLIVVETEDAILVADKSQADRIKNLVTKLPKNLL